MASVDEAEQFVLRWETWHDCPQLATLPQDVTAVFFQRVRPTAITIQIASHMIHDAVWQNNPQNTSTIFSDRTLATTFR